MLRKIAFSILFLLLFSTAHADKIIYPFTPEPIDVIIPSTEKDLPTLDKCIHGIRENCNQVRRIIVVSKRKLTNQAEWFDEAQFPFSMEDVSYFLNQENSLEAKAYMNHPSFRVGWYFQQLVKLYSPFVVPGISSNVLHLDSDTIFLNPVTFMDGQGNGLYNPGTEYHMPYFHHMDRLIPGLKRQFPQHSGISHHMLLQRPALEDFFHTIESLHGKELWKVFCLAVDPKDLLLSGAASDELYFNFVFSKTDQVKVRQLKWGNIPRIKAAAKYRKQKYHYISCHSWMRT